MAKLPNLDFILDELSIFPLQFPYFMSYLFINHTSRYILSLHEWSNQQTYWSRLVDFKTSDD